MTINTFDQLLSALLNNSTRTFIDKANLTSQTANSYASYWRQTGTPGQGAIPGAAATCNNATTGGINFAQQTAPATSYLAWQTMQVSTANNAVEIHDRLAHMGGLSGIVATAQTVSLDLDALLATDNIASRIGDANYSDVSWWLEWYTATGSTAVTATVNVTYNDGSSGNLTAVSLAASRPAGHMVALNSLIPAADSGKFIRDVNTVTLSATTGTAGNFGVTATRQRTILARNYIANKAEVYEVTELGAPEIYNGSCLFPLVLTTNATAGTIRGQGKIAHG